MLSALHFRLVCVCLFQRKDLGVRIIISKIMAKLLVCLVVLVFLTYSVQSLSTGCPLSSQMTNCSPKCKDDTECFGQKCCPNICNAKSCTAANQQSASTKYKGSNSGGTGSYCGNVKCNSFEKCQLDAGTKRQKCVRA